VGRLTSGAIFSLRRILLLCTLYIVCLHSEPFDGLLACDDAKIRIWTIPEDGIDGTLTEPSLYLKGNEYFPHLFVKYKYTFVRKI